MPNRPIIYRAENLAKRLKQIEKAMDLEDYRRQEEDARRAKHAKFIDSTFKSIKADRLAGEKQAPNFKQNSGRPEATKKEALK